MSILKIKWSKVFLFKNAILFIIPAFVCLVAAGYLGSLTPPLIADLGNNYTNEKLYYYTIKLLFYVFLGTYINRALFQLCVNKYVQLLMRNVRNLCYSRWINSFDILSSTSNTSDKYPLGEVLARIMNDSESIRELVTSGSFRLLIDIFFIVSCLVSFIFLNSTTGITIAIAEVLAVVFLLIGSKYMRAIFLSVRKSRGHMSRAIANIVGGVEESYYTNNYDYAKKKSETHFDDYLKKILTSNFWDAAYYSVAESLFPLFLILVAFVVPYSNVVEAGIIFAVIDLVQRSIAPIKDMAGKIANIQRALTGMHRTGQFIGDLDVSNFGEVEYNSKLSNVESMEVDIQSFSYLKDRDNKFELKNIKFEVNKGKLLGVIGYSGSGKSTILNILAGDIIPDKGSITLNLLDGQKNVFSANNEKEILNYRLQVSSVSQDSHIFSESLAFNLSMSESISQELKDFWEFSCREIPYLVSWSKKLEDSIIPKELSMGQKQLLSGLRACFLKKSIVLFDEISSGLDSQLEKALREMVLLIQKNSLTIIVAHRLETVLEADEILVIEDGEISSRGEHSNLLKSSETYQKFIKELSH